MSASIALPIKSVGEPGINPLKRIGRFTLDGSDELEGCLAGACARVLVEIQKIVPRSRLEALVLGGGYGRGEGGVLKTRTGDQPYNDLEFYVFIRGNNWLNERRFGRALHDLAPALTPGTGVEVEFKVISFAKLRRSPVSMFYYDLVVGHRWLWGDEKLLASCDHHRDARKIPLSEATRLLMNRYSGLLFAREKIKHEPFTAEDADFVFRNLAKAQLAFGDAVLTVFGRYHWSCRERNERLKWLSAMERFPLSAEIHRLHFMGMQFKLHPVRSNLTAKELQYQYDEIIELALQLWLWLESRRLGCRFDSVLEYVSSLIDKFSGTNPWRNRLMNVKAFGLAALFQQRSRRHPRERILNALPLLLWYAPALNSELQYWLCRELKQPVEDGTNSLKAYQKLWHQFN